MGAAVLNKVGVEPTGEHSTRRAGRASNRPFNPLVNAGASTAVVEVGFQAIKRMLTTFGHFVGRDVYVDNAIFMSNVRRVRDRALLLMELALVAFEDRWKFPAVFDSGQCTIWPS